MTIETSVQNESLAQKYAADITEASLHSGDPGGTGANELTGIPRQAITWTPGATDGVVVSNLLSFPVPADTDIAHVGLWGGGVYRDGIFAMTSFVEAGTYQIVITYTQL